MQMPRQTELDEELIMSLLDTLQEVIVGLEALWVSLSRLGFVEDGGDLTTPVWDPAVDVVAEPPHLSRQAVPGKSPGKSRRVATAAVGVPVEQGAVRCDDD